MFRSTEIGQVRIIYGFSA